MATDDDLFDLERIDREVNHGNRIEIGVHNEVGHVAVDEYLAWRKPDDLIGGDPAVGAADP